MRFLFSKTESANYWSVLEIFFSLACTALTDLVFISQVAYRRAFLTKVVTGAASVGEWYKIWFYQRS